MRDDLTVALRLQADGSSLNSATQKAEGDVKGLRKGVDRLNNSMRRHRGAASIMQAGLRRVRSAVFSLNGVIGTLSVALLGKSLISAAAEAEGFAVRLKVLLGSVEEGNRLFQDMAEFAGRVPFEYREIMSGATQLAGVMKGGVDEINEWMPLIADLAAVSGLGIEQTTQQVVRMYSAGAASADLFRERGILAMLGFKAGVTYTAEETREQLMRSWNKTDSQFKDASKELGKTWDGLMSMFADKWFSFRNKINKAGVFEGLKSKAQDLLDKLNELEEDGTLDRWAGNIAKSLSVAADAAMTLARVLGVSGALYVGLVATRTAVSLLRTGVKLLAIELIAATALLRTGGTAAALFTTGLTASAAATWANIKAFGFLNTAVTGVLAAFAGWEIGSLLYNSSKEVRAFAASFVGTSLTAWQHVKAAWRGGVAVLKDAWSGFLDWVTEKYAAILDSAAGGFEFIKLQGVADKLRGVAAGIRGEVADREQLSTVLARIAKERDLEIDKIKGITDGLILHHLGVADLTAQTDLNTAANNNNNKTREKTNELLKEQQALMDRLYPDDAKFKQYSQELNELAKIFNIAENGETQAYLDAVDRLTDEYLFTGMEEKAAKTTTKTRELYKNMFDGMGHDMEQFGEVGASSFRRLNDELADFITTGKMDLRGFVSYALNELAKIAIYQTVTRPLYDEASSIFAGLFHSGGVVGEGGGVGRQVPALAFAGAPRFHSGGIAGDEVPAILKRGEEVLTADDPRHRNNGGGGGGSNNTYNIDARGADAGVEQRIEAAIERAQQLTEARLVRDAQHNRGAGRLLRS